MEGLNETFLTKGGGKEAIVQGLEVLKDQDGQDGQIRAKPTKGESAKKEEDRKNAHRGRKKHPLSSNTTGSRSPQREKEENRGFLTPLPPHHGFDLQERTFRFARQATLFCRRLPETVENVEHIRQLIRFSASVGANYIEANEALGKNNFTMHARISRKEAEESAFFLRLLTETNAGEEYREEGEALTQEAMELKKIFSANVLKCEGK